MDENCKLYTVDSRGMIIDIFVNYLMSNFPSETTVGDDIRTKWNGTYEYVDRCVIFDTPQDKTAFCLRWAELTKRS